MTREKRPRTKLAIKSKDNNAISVGDKTARRARRDVRVLKNPPFNPISE